MPRHTEEERQRARRRTPRPGSVPTSGGGPREFFRDLKRSAGNVFADTIAEGREAATEIAEAGSRFGESPARSGEAVRKVGGQIIEGIGQTALGFAGDVLDPARARKTVAEVGRSIGGFFGLGIDRPPESEADLPPTTDQGPAQFVGPPNDPTATAPAQPPDPAPTLANAGREAVPAPPAANQDGRFVDGVPEGFINVIRGTQQSFLRDTGGPEFRAVPGQTLGESEQIAARRDPAFNVVTNEDLERGRINATTIAAEAQKLQALFGNSQVGFNDEQQIILAVPNASGGFDEISGFTPVIDGLVDQGGNFSISRVPGEGGVFESAVVLNEDTGETRDITQEQFLGKAFTEYNNAIRRRGGGNLTIDERLEILEEVEELMGDLPEIESAILSGQ